MNEQSSQQQLQQYSFARASIQAGDITKKPPRIEKSVLEMLDENPKKEDLFSPKDEQLLATADPSVIPINETTTNARDQTPSLSNGSAADKILSFFSSAVPKISSSSSKFSLALLAAIKDKQKKRECEAKTPPTTIPSSNNLDPLNTSNQAKKPVHTKARSSTQIAGAAVTNPQFPQQDFGNISEIQELKQNHFPMNDDTAQEEEDFKSLLANNQINLSSVIGEPVNTKQQQQVSPSKQPQRQQNPSSKESAGKEQRERGRKEGRDQGKNEQQSPTPSAQVASTHQQHLIEEANRKKRLLEEKLRAVSSEINHLLEDEDGARGSTVDGERSSQKQQLHASVNRGQSQSSQKKQSQLQKVIGDDQSAQERAFELVRRMNKTRLEKQQRAQKESRAFAEQIAASTVDAIEEKSRVKAELAQKNLNSINQRMENIKQRKAQRQQAHQQSNQLIREIQQGVEATDPKERYFREVEQPELERRKQELAEKRKMYRPISIEVIREHAQKHDEEMRLRKLQAKANIIDYAEELETLPKSNIMREVMEKDKQAKMKNVLEQQKVKEQIERRKEYARLVKEVHKPTVKHHYHQRGGAAAADHFRQLAEVDENANEFFQEQSELSREDQQSNTDYTSITHGKLKRKGYESLANFSNNEHPSVAAGRGSSPRLIYGSGSAGGEKHHYSNRFPRGGRGVGRSRRTNNNREAEGNNNNNLYDVEGSAARPPVPPRSQQFSGMSGMSAEQLEAAKAKRQVQGQAVDPTLKGESLAVQPQQNKRFEKNYINELRNQRVEQEKKGKVSKLDDWEKYKYDPSLSQKEKYAHILQSATRLEQNARIKELNSAVTFEQQEVVNNLYINSIKAKLALLDNLA